AGHALAEHARDLDCLVGGEPRVEVRLAELGRLDVLVGECAHVGVGDREAHRAPEGQEVVERHAAALADLARGVAGLGGQHALDEEAAAHAAAGFGGLGLALDVTRRASFSAFLDAAASRYGPLDVLVNNAGVMHVGPFLEEDDAWTARQLAINTGGVALGMKL